MATIAVRMLKPTQGDDVQLVGRLAALTNEVYAVAESGLWRDGATRTTTAELAGLIRAGEIAVATRDDRVVGSIRIHDVSGDASEFGILVADPEQRSIGIGRALVSFAEERAYERGLRATQLELLVPREWRHPSKEFLEAWYTRIGYRLVRTGSLGDGYPHLVPMLATPCDLRVYEKSLRSEASGR